MSGTLSLASRWQLHEDLVLVGWAGAFFVLRLTVLFTTTSAISHPALAPENFQELWILHGCYPPGNAHLLYMEGRKRALILCVISEMYSLTPTSVEADTF